MQGKSQNGSGNIPSLKLAQIKEELLKGNVSDETIEIFFAKLNRVKDNGLKCQHCYTTAVDIDIKFSEYAIKMIQYALDNFAESWLDYHRSYYNMGSIYEKNSQWENARSEYIKSMQAVKEASIANKNVYINFLSGDLLRVEMHCSDFNYSEELVRYYNNFLLNHEFERETVNNKLVCAVAEIIIYSYENKNELAKNSYKEALEILKPNYRGKLYYIFKSHRYKEKANASQQMRAYLEKMSVIFEGN